MATGIYIRVSTVGQNEVSQRKEIDRWLKGNGIADAVYFIDKGKTGDNLDRPAFAKLQQAVFNGEIKTIVVWKLDRLSRNLRDGINTLADWCDRGLRVVSVTQGFDFSGPTGKLVAALLLGIAEMETATRRERQTAGIAAVMADPDLRAEKYQGRKPGATSAVPTEAKRLRDKGLTHDEIAKQLEVSRRTVLRYLHAG
ncbi:MAG TPA: recombinase family protein [Pirellulales bacterium]|jgi:DNA invertase Pin-like site-specific DNA recombinase|nr:recombinase family protein [Pirellulales bacterium]